MARRNKGNGTESNGNGVTRSHRKRGEKLPQMLTTSVVLRALEGMVSVEDFTTAYDIALSNGSLRGRAAVPPTASDLEAYGVFTSNGDFNAFCAATGRKSASASSLIRRCAQHTIKNGNS